MFKGQADRRFQSDNTEGRLVVLERLLIRVMRRVVSRDRVNRTVTQAFEKCLDMILTAQRRAHFCVLVIVLDCFISQSPMVRRDFASHRQTSFFGASYCLDCTAS